MCLNADLLGLNTLRTGLSFLLQYNTVKHLHSLWLVVITLNLVLHVKLLGKIYQQSHMNLIH